MNGLCKEREGSGDINWGENRLEEEEEEAGVDVEVEGGVVEVVILHTRGQRAERSGEMDITDAPIIDYCTSIRSIQRLV